MKTKTINGVDFKVIYANKPEKWCKAPTFTKWDYADIYSAYVNPSQAKREIWKYWQDWARCACASIWISSRTCQHFSLGGRVCDEDGTPYAIHITHTKQELIPIKV